MIAGFFEGNDSVLFMHKASFKAAVNHILYSVEVFQRRVPENRDCFHAIWILTPGRLFYYITMEAVRYRLFQ